MEYEETEKVLVKETEKTSYLLSIALEMDS